MDVHIILDDPAGNSYLQVSVDILNILMIILKKIIIVLIYVETNHQTLLFVFCFQNIYAPDPDPEMKIEKYTRTFEHNEDLGLNDMKTEGYAET